MDSVPVIVRGHNVAVFLPPVTEAALPLIQAATKRPALILTADADRAAALASGVDDAFAVTGLTRAERRLKIATPKVLVVSVLDALALLRRSAFQLSAFQLLVLAWPEQLDDEGSQALESVMAECDKDAQRIILTSETGPATGRLVERYAFKAMTYGLPSPEGPPAQSSGATVGAARYVIARPSQLADVRRRIFDALHPDDEDTLLIAGTPASRDDAAALLKRGGDVPPVIVAEAHQLPWLRSLFAPLSHVPLPTAADAAEQRAEKLRGRVMRVLESENLDRELFIVAPLFERYDPALVAAGLLKLVAGQAAPPAAGLRPQENPATPSVPSFAKVWVGIGKKDNVKPGDLVGAIVNEVKVPAEALGKIEVRDLFCLVEVRAEQAEKVASGLTGVNLRGRRLTARVDRGPGPGPHRPPRRV